MTKFQGISKSHAVRTGTIAPRHKRSKNEAEEFPHAPKGYEVCPTCNSIFFNKAWHHPSAVNMSFDNKKNIKTATCPACQMKKDHVFEGELVIKMPGINPEMKKDIMNAIENSDKMATEKDPMDRILWTEANGDELHVFTSENQLAVKIGKKLESAFKGGKMEIHHSHEEDIIRIYWTAPLS
jgi:hypothetical protein